MAAKRRATSELFKDQEEEVEDEVEDTYQKASEDSLKRRVIKTARRRNPISSVRGNEESENKGAFTGLMFSNVPPTTTNAFSFLSNLTVPNTQPKVNGISENIKKPDSGNNSTPTSSTNTMAFVNSNSLFDDYYSKLKGLNESVLTWIKKHVDANPLINLQPIFKDYESYFKELEIENDSKATSDTSKPKAITENHKSVTSMGGFVFKASQNVPDSTTGKISTTDEISTSGIINSEPQKTSLEKSIPKFSFGSQTSTVSLGSVPSFSFGNLSTHKTFPLGTPNASTSTTPASISNSFSFGASNPTTNSTFSSPTTPFTFANVAKPPSEGTKKDPDDEEYQPPKNDFKPVEESDHIYTIRCKVFVKKDDKFGDRGVGNLYLKTIENSEKYQLIVRADTSLGNLLCNFILSGSIPTKRLGTKDVMLVCLPTPDCKPPPVPILLRVKSSEEADKLLEVLEKHKK
ncbi:hypothetical protein JTB14_008253 [Gonioctena quinquepunctata]|nr:hypothetical protein JTB14_008253 [Gonioctena quinquepunctata]